MNEQVSAITHAATAALERLNPRERRLIGTFAFLAVLALAYLAVVEPIVGMRAGMERRIEALSNDLGAMEALATRIRRLESEAGGDPSATQVSEGFSLFSFMDRATSSSVASEAVAAMNPTRRKLPDGRIENSVELKLQDIALTELVGLLRQIETSNEPVYIKRLDLRRRYDDETRFDATVIAGAFSPT
jgi:type II secretory pathway component PulM